MLSENVIVREVRNDEISTLLSLSRSTYITAFAHLNKASDMELYLEQAFTLRKTKEEYKNPESFFFFAEYKGKLVGYLKLNLGKAQTETPFKNALEIQRIYVVEGFQGLKIGEHLLHFTTQFAISKKVDVIWLGVWEKNERAIAFYERHGYHIFSNHEFWLGTDLQFDYLMQFKLPEA
ncbi:ribosomal protein S18 acetylase RimI-like enzyme [Ulvibacter sp. MAR_2010_11]|uniref:GNAT family N-acetyltransferase n=1 Tax=Ulvibacter sp. MAR_2010_11 TaxID=1250229 RepID=UPI000C2C0B57|nr:GNAT family N-acetyltransferase [Ulvibacter sp. MAR_2010_11]PKA83512.1 ribosomal protein S18 acetylase RimI-like enzyme [Ulvibacter sp. MAR_2010_11]